MRAGAAGEEPEPPHSIGRPAPLSPVPGSPLLDTAACCSLAVARRGTGRVHSGQDDDDESISYAAGLMSDDDVPPFPPCWPDQFQSGRASSSWSRCTPSSVTVPPAHAHHKSMHTGTDTGRDRHTTTSTHTHIYIYIWTYMCILTD